jgi:anti-anti-sigma factor
MNVDVRKMGDVVIVDFKGRLVAGDGDEILSQVIDELLAEDYRKILLNLSEVEAIDSMGLGELVQSYKIAQRFGAAIHLLQPRDRVKKSLHLTKLLPLFPVHETEEEAVKSFVAPAEPREGHA